MDLNEQYEKLLARRIAQANRKIVKYFESAIQTLTPSIEKITYKGQVFSLSDYPQLKAKIEAQLKQMHGNIYTTTVNGIKESWKLSNKKNDHLVDKRLASKNPTKRMREVLYDPNLGAMDQFTKRRSEGLNLSDRIWNTIDPFRHQLEAGLGLGISTGQSAKSLAKDLKQYLWEPDRLYRRVRTSNGKLKLSNAAKAYHPGQGVYRSSVKNAQRLTRSENNMAYRTADHERWKALPFVIGIEVRLSAQHPRYDICDVCAGRYPKDFKFTGWHPQCLCHAIPVMMNDSDYSRLQDSILGISDFDPTSVKQVTDLPDGFVNFVQGNHERIAGWKITPYWVKDNRSYYSQAKAASGTPPVKKAVASSSLVPGGKAIGAQFNTFDKAIEKPARSALSHIDSVHGDGALKNIPFKAMRSESLNGALYLNNRSEAVHIGLSTKGKHQELTALHEIGHFLDLHSGDIKSKFDSDLPSTAIRSVIDKAMESDCLKNIQASIKTGKITVDGKEERIQPNYKKYLKYLMEPKEIWARSYAQFIAKRTGNKLLLEQLQTRIEVTQKNGALSQWLDTDFIEIEKEIETAMIKMGWMINQ